MAFVFLACSSTAPHPFILLPDFTDSSIKIVYLLRSKPDVANGKNQIYQNR